MDSDIFVRIHIYIYADHVDERLCAHKPDTCLACLNGFHTFESLIPMELCATGMGQTQTYDPTNRSRRFWNANCIHQPTLLDPWTHRRKIHVKTGRSKFTCIPFESRCASSFVRASLACQVCKIYRSISGAKHHQRKL